jgi:FkbM family methyltransferase
MKPFLEIKEIVSLDRRQFEKQCTAFTQNAYIGNHVQLCKVLTKYKMYVDTRDIGIVPHLILDGFWESWITKWIATVINPGDICVDLGANFGYYSLLLSDLSGKTGKTIAVEPNPYICELLKKTAIINEWSFDVIEGAVSNKNGQAILTVENMYLGGGTIMSLDENLPDRSRLNVATYTLDFLVSEKNLEKIDFIKMDCEGFEPFVLEGMNETIKKNPQLKIVMEYSPYSYNDPANFITKILSRFNVFMINGDSCINQLTIDDFDQLIKYKRPVDLYLTVRI